jgi:peptide/nickel transport system substrate-binding protein
MSRTIRTNVPSGTATTVTTRRRLLQQAAVAGAAAGVALSAASPAGLATALPAPVMSRARQDAPAGQVTYASVRDVFTFDPRAVNTTEELGLMQHVCEPLIRLDAEMNLVPHLAESWEAVDSLTWELRLRAGVKFHNGEDFNAESVRFSFEDYRRLGESYPWFYLWPGELPEVEVVDDTTVRLVSSVPSPTAPRNLVVLPILPAEASGSDDFGQHPVGTGPFAFVERQQDVRLELEAFPDYWGTPPSFEKLVYRPIPDPSARMVAIQTGEVDVAASIPPDLIPVLEAEDSLTITQVPGVRIAHFPFNFRNPDSPLADVRVREALTRAVDGESILQNILAGAGEPLMGPVPSTLFGATDLGGYPGADPEGARAMLEEAGYPMDTELRLIYTPGEFIKDREITEALQAQLAEAGVQVRIDELEGGAYSEERRTANWDIAINGFSTQNGDPGYFLTWATSDPTTFGYDDQATKDVIAEAQQTVDEADREALLGKAQEMYWEDIPYLWGYTQTEVVAVSNRLTGLEMLSNGWLLFGDATIAE